ncbi:hypothetical protein SteCoe_2390 [Stentor coeruleus]|uniref:Uncharacterized protein n=1 Tax=Stentor coeruleus TaxID=5963 RepID=A0A1R2CZQ6_9CILI|nr:hypothetical protein SteCoe_2390 [Stentor coeruleus]
MSHRRAYTQFLQKPKHHIAVCEFPADLANSIIEKEIELEKNPSMILINELIALYTKAVEHYETQDNPKYLDFQERMHKMLLRPEILCILQKDNTKDFSREIGNTGKRSLSPKKILVNDEKMGLEIRKEQVEEDRKNLACQFTNVLSNGSSCLNLIKSVNENTESVLVKIVESIKEQDLELEKRVAMRKRNRYAKSQNFSLLSKKSQIIDNNESYMEEGDTTCTKSSLFTSDDIINEKFEKRLEELMEQNLSEKALKILETKMNYESQISELSEGSGLLNLVVDEMKKNMNEEITQIVEFYDNKRKEEIKKLKEEIYN